jgi:hypothetical protein
MGCPSNVAFVALTRYTGSPSLLVIAILIPF